MTELDERAAKLRAYLSADPGNVELACDLVDTLFEAGQVEAADAVLASLSPDTQSAPGLRFRRARCALMLGRYADAAEVLRTLIDGGQDNVALWHDLAFSQLCLRDTVAARQTLDAVVARHGDTVELANVRARVAMMDEDFDTAFAALAAALAIDPDHATSLGLVALGLLDSGRADEAGVAAQACLHQHPDQHEALLVAGTVALWKQDIETASANFQRGLARHPNSGRALSGLGQVNMLRNDLPSARKVLEHAVVAMPDHIGTWHALAWTDLLMGDLAAGEQAYRKGFDLDRNFAESHGGLALIDALKGRIDDAEQGIRRALRLNPQCMTALYAQTVLLSDSGHAGEANQMLATLMAQSPTALEMDIGEFARKLRAHFVGQAS